MRSLPAYEVAAPAPVDAREALDLAYLADLHRRWNRCLAACSGNREHALAVWRDVLRVELRAARELEAANAAAALELDGAIQTAIEGWHG